MILGIVSAAPMPSCNKIQRETITNKYKVTLENPEDAKDVIEIVENFQLTITDPLAVESKLEPSGDESVGNLSKRLWFGILTKCTTKLLHHYKS